MKRVERSFADLEYESKKRKTRRERFLERMEVLVRWERLLEEIRPYYPKAGKGRAPYGLESILNWQNAWITCLAAFWRPGPDRESCQILSIPPLLVHQFPQAWGESRIDHCANQAVNGHS